MCARNRPYEAYRSIPLQRVTSLHRLAQAIAPLNPLMHRVGLRCVIDNDGRHNARGASRRGRNLQRTIALFSVAAASP